MIKRTSIRAIALAAILPLAGCSDLLDVESPGRISDDDLRNEDAVPGIVAGMKYDLSQAVDGSAEFLALFAVDLWHGGSYSWGNIPRGLVQPEDVGGVWSSPQQARWVAEHGLERIQEILGDGFGRSPLVAEAYLYAGFSNRMLGESFCSSVIDGGPEIPNTDHFSRAMDHFTQAIDVGGRAGRKDLVNAGYAGRALMKAWLGDWGGAADDAQQVPVDFEFDAEVDTELRNELTYETHSRFEYTVWGTIFEDHHGDPRIPWDTVFNADGSIAQGANGATLHFQQKKYTQNSSDYPLTKGTEMLVLRAEAALRDGNIPGAYALMNQARNFHEMEELPEADNMEDAWDDLQFERRATTWLEGRAVWDLRRWFAESGPAHNDFLADRDKCIPISETERASNPNLRG